jgi:transcriptional regulator with XRE-family HTH domain
MANYDPNEFYGKLLGVGVSRPYASQLAQGARTPSMSFAMSICERLGISLDVWREISEWKAATQSVATAIAVEHEKVSTDFPKVPS